MVFLFLFLSAKKKNFRFQIVRDLGQWKWTQVLWPILPLTDYIFNSVLGPPFLQWTRICPEVCVSPLWKGLKANTISYKSSWHSEAKVSDHVAEIFFFFSCLVCLMFPHKVGVVKSKRNFILCFYSSQPQYSALLIFHFLIAKMSYYFACSMYFCFKSLSHFLREK